MLTRDIKAATRTLEIEKMREEAFPFFSFPFEKISCSGCEKINSIATGKCHVIEYRTKGLPLDQVSQRV